MDELLYKDESKTLLGLAMLLHRELGCGLQYKFYPNRPDYKSSREF